MIDSRQSSPCMIFIILGSGSTIFYGGVFDGLEKHI
jgi:hypothetical protein